MTTIGARLKQLRLAAGLSQATLGKKASVSQQTIAKIEREGSREPKTLHAIATALSIGYDEFMKGVENPRLTKRTKRSTDLGSVRSRRSRAHWPFSVAFARFDALDRSEKNMIDGLVLDKINEYEGRRQLKPKSTR